MTLDLNLFRAHEGGAPEDIRESQRRRGADPALVDAVIEADVRWRELRQQVNVARSELAKAKAIGRPQRGGGAKASAASQAVDDADAPSSAAPAEQPRTKEELSHLSRAATAAAAAELEAQATLQSLLLRVGNLVHEDAPVTPARSSQLATSQRTSQQQPAQQPRRRKPTARLPSCAHESALQRLVGSGMAEEVQHASWRPTGSGLQLQHAWLAHAIAFVTSRGYELIASPVHASSDRKSKFGTQTKYVERPAGKCMRSLQDDL